MPEPLRCRGECSAPPLPSPPFVPQTTTAAEIRAAALERIRHFGTDYSVAGAPRSPHPLLSANRVPDETPLGWLRSRYKCNQFVGDVLTAAGVMMPTYRMRDGSRHYMNAEVLPRQSSHFQRIERLDAVRQGDVIVIDYAGSRGENGAHTEIVTAASARPGQATLQTAGAHKDGAYLTDNSDLWRSLPPSAPGGAFALPDATVYFLRPIKAGLG